jgi:hypothetical protein
MGSHPRVADRRGTYDLFGPVSKLWAQSYDRAMAIYLACLREFGDFARARCEWEIWLGAEALKEELVPGGGAFSPAS